MAARREVPGTPWLHDDPARAARAHGGSFDCQVNIHHRKWSNGTPRWSTAKAMTTFHLWYVHAHPPPGTATPSVPVKLSLSSSLCTVQIRDMSGFRNPVYQRRYLRTAALDVDCSDVQSEDLVISPLIPRLNTALESGARTPHPQRRYLRDLTATSDNYFSDVQSEDSVMSPLIPRLNTALVSRTPRPQRRYPRDLTANSDH